MILSRFESLFGIAPDEVHTHCVVTPFLPPKLLEYLGIKKLRRGKMYGAENIDNFTFIKSGVGATLTGDAILALQETACEHILFIGAAGACEERNNIPIGSLVTPNESVNCESFTDTLLHQHEKLHTSFADQLDLEKLLAIDDANLTQVRCVSFGSLFLENYCSYLFKDLNADVVEMETAAVFEAAKHIGRYATAVLYITDILGNRPYWEDLPAQEQQQVDQAIKQIPAIIHKFCKF